MMVKFERADGLGSIVLANPPFNRIDVRFATELQDAVHLAGESDVRAVVVRAEGPNFCLGGDLTEWTGKDRNWFRTYVGAVNAGLRALEALRLPTVAIVQGKAVGGGFELALSCDFILAAEEASFLCVEVTAGMVPLAGGLQRLAERIGRSRALRLAISAKPIGALEAASLGLVTATIPQAGLAEGARGFLEELVTGPTQAYAAARTLLKAWAAGGVGAADAIMLDVAAMLFATEDAKAGIGSRVAAMASGEPSKRMRFVGE